MCRLWVKPGERAETFCAPRANTSRESGPKCAVKPGQREDLNRLIFSQPDIFARADALCAGWFLQIPAKHAGIGQTFYATLCEHFEYHKIIAQGHRLFGLCSMHRALSSGAQYL